MWRQPPRGEEGLGGRQQAPGGQELVTGGGTRRVAWPPQPPGPWGQAIGTISLGKRRLWDKACISKTLGQASTQAWRVRVTPTSILAALLHFHSKSMLQVTVGKPRRLPVPSQVRTTVPSQGSLGPSGVSAGGSTSFLPWSGSRGGWGGLRPTQLVPLACKGTVPKPVYEKCVLSELVLKSYLQREGWRQCLRKGAPLKPKCRSSQSSKILSRPLL